MEIREPRRQPKALFRRVFLVSRLGMRAATRSLYPLSTVSPANLAAHGLDGALNAVSASVRLASLQNNGASTLSATTFIRGKTPQRLSVHQMSRIPPSNTQVHAPDAPGSGTIKTGGLGMDRFGTRASFQGVLGMLIRGDILERGVS